MNEMWFWPGKWPGIFAWEFVFVNCQMSFCVTNFSLKIEMSTFMLVCGLCQHLNIYACLWVVGLSPRRILTRVTVLYAQLHSNWLHQLQEDTMSYRATTLNSALFPRASHSKSGASHLSLWTAITVFVNCLTSNICWGSFRNRAAPIIADQKRSKTMQICYQCIQWSN